MFGAAQTGDFDVIDGWKGVALADYAAATKEEISLTEDDVVEIEHQCENGWWIGKNKRTKARGIFPGSYVEVVGPMKVKVPKENAASQQQQDFDNPEAFMMAMDNAIDKASAAGGASATIPEGSEPWNWGKMERDEAVSKLKGKANGTFLVRESTSSKGAYTISVVCENEARHIKLVKKAGGWALNAKESAHPTLAKLIDAKLGEKLAHKLSANKSGEKSESQLLTTPLVNPANKKYAQGGGGGGGKPPPPNQQRPAAAATGAPAPLAATSGLAPPPSKTGASGKTPYARQRGGAANVAATSQISVGDSGPTGRAIRDAIPGGVQAAPPASADPFATSAPAATTSAAVDPFAVAPPAAADPFAAPAPTTSAAVDPFAAAPPPAAADPFATPVVAPVVVPTPAPVVATPAPAPVPVAVPTPAPVAAPPPAAAPTRSFLEVLNEVWAGLAKEDDLVGGGVMMPMMQRSGLPNPKLGEIWSKVDAEGKGKMTYVQVGYVIGLMSQAQRGETLDIGVLGPNTIPPTLS